MDLLTNLLEGKSSELLGALTSSGFSADQASAFLPKALSGIMDAVQKIGLPNLLGRGSSDLLGTVMGELDVNALASTVGGDRALASDGVQTLLPKVMDFLQGDKANAGLAGLAGMAKGLFN